MALQGMTIGQAGASVQIMMWIGVILLAAVFLGVVGYILRRRLLSEDDDPAAAEPFTLSDLRRLHREGQLSDEEFERARAAIIARTRAHLHKAEQDEDDTDADRPASP